MEDKAIKVKCKWSDGTLQLEKLYLVIKENNLTYVIKNDFKEEKPYLKDMFEEVKEDILMVKCIDNEGIEDNFELGEVYKVDKEDNNVYFIKVNSGIFSAIKSRFKPVPKEKEQKQLTLQEVFGLKDGEEYKSEFRKIRRQNNIIIVESTQGTLINLNLDTKFTKTEEPKPVSTVEAFKALEEGKTIESVETLNQYRKHTKWKELLVCPREENVFKQVGSVYFIELQNQWLIIE